MDLPLNSSKLERSYISGHHIKIYVWIALAIASFLLAINGYLYFLRLSYLQQGAETARQNEQMIRELREKRSIPSDPGKIDLNQAMFCGGIAGIACPSGSQCILEATYPDAGGKCIKDDQAKLKGFLSGVVSIGPNCPVEREGVVCTPSPEAYTAREFIVLDGNKKEVIRFHADTNGKYFISLLPGTYIVESANIGMGYMGKDLPATVMIKAGQDTVLNIDIDTGIR